MRDEYCDMNESYGTLLHQHRELINKYPGDFTGTILMQILLIVFTVIYGIGVYNDLLYTFEFNFLSGFFKSSKNKTIE